MTNPYAVAERPVASAEHRMEDLVQHIMAGNRDGQTYSIAMDEIWTRISSVGDPLVERTLAVMRVKTAATSFIEVLGKANMGVSNLSESTVWFRSWAGFGTIATILGGDISIAVNAGQLDRMYAENLRRLLHTLQGRKI